MITNIYRLLQMTEAHVLIEIIVMFCLQLPARKVQTFVLRDANYIKS